MIKIKLNIINFEKTNLNYIVELRKKIGGKFIQIYEGENKNCLVTNLNRNTIYEIRICCKYKNIFGHWSKTNEIKTTDI